MPMEQSPALDAQVDRSGFRPRVRSVEDTPNRFMNPGKSAQGRAIKLRGKEGGSSISLSSSVGWGVVRRSSDEIRESRMSTGAEFAGHRPHGEEARGDERSVRILFVEDRADVAGEIRETLAQAVRGSFDVVRERNLVAAVAQIEGQTFDLLLIDPLLPDVERSTAIEFANELANRLPVVVLTGTEALADQACLLQSGLKSCIERADLPGKLLSAIRHSRRLGTGTMSPLFCRIEGLCL